MLILELILQLMCPRQGIIRKHVGNKRKRKRGGVSSEKTETTLWAEMRCAQRKKIKPALGKQNNPSSWDRGSCHFWVSWNPNRKFCLGPSCSSTVVLYSTDHVLLTLDFRVYFFCFCLFLFVWGGLISTSVKLLENLNSVIYPVVRI